MWRMAPQAMQSQQPPPTTPSAVVLPYFFSLVTGSGSKFPVLIPVGLYPVLVLLLFICF